MQKKSDSDKTHVKASDNQDPQKTILIVDDDVALAEVYRARLEVEGFNVAVVYDGEEALRWLSGAEADMIIMDCMLPRFGGLSVLETLNEGKPKSYKTPVLMVSGLDRPEYQSKAEELGAIGYLVKSSASISEMVDAVHAGLSSGVKGFTTNKQTSGVEA